MLLLHFSLICWYKFTNTSFNNNHRIQYLRLWWLWLRQIAKRHRKNRNFPISFFLLYDAILNKIRWLWCKKSRRTTGIALSGRLCKCAFTCNFYFLGRKNHKAQWICKGEHGWNHLNLFTLFSHRYGSNIYVLMLASRPTIILCSLFKVRLSCLH